MVAEVAGQPFDLAGGCRCGRGCSARPDVHVLVLVLHHIAADGWSMGLLARDLSAAVRGAAGGPGAGLGAAAGAVRGLRAVAAGAAGRRRDPGSLLAGQVAGGGRLAGWRRRSWRCPRTGRGRRWPGHRGHAVSLTVAAPGACRAGGAGPRAGRDDVHGGAGGAGGAAGPAGRGTGDIPVGAPVAGRTDAALDDLVGFFVNTLVLRTDVSGDPAFTELLGRVREAGLGALEHQDVPFERLVEVLAPERSLARHPLFQVHAHRAEHRPGRRWTCPGCGARRCRRAAAGRGSTWTCSVGETSTRDGPGGLRGSVTAAADLFDRGRSAALAGRLVRVLARGGRRAGGAAASGGGARRGRAAAGAGGVERHGGGRCRR